MFQKWFLKFDALSPRLVACLVLTIVGASRPVDARAQDKVSGAEHADAARQLDGLWSGSWGGGARDGVVFQPVLAELLIDGDRVALRGFRGVTALAGKLRIDAGANTLELRADPTESDAVPPKAVRFSYTLEDKTLTLTDADGVEVTLQRVDTDREPMSQAGVEFVTATSLSRTGELELIEYTMVQTARAGTVYFRPRRRVLNTANGTTIRVVQESGWKTLSLPQARSAISTATPVVLLKRHVPRGAPNPNDVWHELGEPAPESESVWKTFSRVLQPGTLVFIVPAIDTVPEP